METPSLSVSAALVVAYLAGYGTSFFVHYYRNNSVEKKT